MPMTANVVRQASPLQSESDAMSVASTASFDGYSAPSAQGYARHPMSVDIGASTCRNASVAGHVHGPACSRVLLHDQELWKRAHDTRAAINFRKLTDLEVTQWRWKASNSRFTLFQRQVEQRDHPTIVRSTAHEFLSAGEVRCSAAELINILRPTTESDHNAAMQALYKKDFIYGSSVLVLPAATADDGDVSEQRATVTSSVSGISGSASGAQDEQLAVKTSTFVRSGLLGKNEQWCYLEHFKRHSGADPDSGFTITISSMHESELRSGKADRDRVVAVHDINAGYLVEKVPNESLLRVLFYAQYTDINSDIKGNASSSAMKSRLAFLAKGAARLPDVVRRRRLGAQTFANRMAFAAKNSRCICCTKSLHLFSKKKRCYLCGYFVCDKDWSIQSVETREGKISTVRVCGRCLEGVESCDYAHVAPHQLGAPRIHADPPNMPSPSATMATFLRNALRSAGSESKKRSVQSVIKHLIGQEEAKARAGSSSFSLETALTDESTEREYHAALDAYLKVDDIPLEECVLANAETRAYPIDVPEDPSSGAAPAFPIAPNEAERLNTIEREHINKIGNAEEFNIIASIAARELDCHASLITVITEDQQLVLGANLEDLQKMEMPREHVFCSHTILDDKPLVLPHPEADVRFANFMPVKQAGVKFYCGFPIVSRDNTVVGSVCCIDMKSHELTQSQYAAMTKLAATASKVMQLKGQEIETRTRAATTYMQL